MEVYKIGTPIGTCNKYFDADIYINGNNNVLTFRVKAGVTND